VVIETLVVATILAAVCMFVLVSRQNLVGIATIGDAGTKLSRCVVGTKMQVKFEDGCGMSVASQLGRV